MQKPSEKQLAKGAYGWLRASPLVTVTTYFFLSAFGFGDGICGFFACTSDFLFHINAGISILGSALWHLILLQYINNKESDFVRWHGLQAALIAGIRTLIPILFLGTDFVFGAAGYFYCWTIPVLMILWAVATPWGNKQVERGECTFAKWMGKTVTPPSDNQIEEINQTIPRNNGLSSKETLAEEITSHPNQTVSTGGNMTETEPRKPEDVLEDVLNGLRNDDAVNRLNALMQLDSLNYSSEAIRNELEILALNDGNEDVRKDALAALDLPIHRNIRSRFNKIERDSRYILLQEIGDWEKLGLLEKQKADVLRRRYDFDFTPPTAPKPVSVQPTVPAPKQIPAPKAQPVQPQPEPAGPRPSLLQTLLSEASIKIYLYLGAFFVIASAAIIGAAVPELRLPILIIGTLIFGGLSVFIKKRLPQPSFALFIVFSFLLPITANTIEETLRHGFNLSPTFSAGYWVFVYFTMAIIWGGGAWLYESRLFSITAFISLTLAFTRVGDIFVARPEFYTSTTGLAALAGLAGVWALKKWKDAAFALPLFITVQVLQLAVLGISLIVFIQGQVVTTTATPLWNLASVFTWGFAFLFYALSDQLFPFFFFPWLAAGTLIPMPWLMDAAFDMESLFPTLLFAIWGLVISIVSEAAYPSQSTRKYSLPILIASIPTFAAAQSLAFFFDTQLGFAVALGVAVIYGVLHFIRPRGWLWTLALLSFIIAYFAFFALPLVKGANIFFGHQLLGLSLLLLLPDLLLKNDFKADPAWRLPLRIYGALFTIFNFIAFTFTQEKPLINTAIIFGVYAVFFAIYALRYDKALIGYIATLALTISVIYTLDHFELNLWLEALGILSALYFLGGFVLRRNGARAAWRTMLEASGLTLGGIVSVLAVSTPKEYGGWFIAIIGALFIIEMYSRKQSLFEIGAHIMLSIAAYLILHDFQINELSFTLAGISLVILGLDMIFTRTYRQARPLEWLARGMGAVIALTAGISLMTEGNLQHASSGFMIFTVFFLIYTAVQRKAIYGYIPAAYLALAVFYTLENSNTDAWLPSLTGLAILYFGTGLAIRSKPDWSFMLRNSALALGTLVSLGALLTLKETGGWYALVIGLLFAAEMYLSRDGWFEIGVPAMFNIGAFLILRDFKAEEISRHLLTYSLVWLVSDLISHHAFKDPRPLKWIVRGIGTLLAAANFGFLFFNADPKISTMGFGIYTLLFLTISLLYRQPNLLYAFTSTLPLFVTFLFRSFDVTKWIHPVIFIAMMYYAVGFFFRLTKRATGWDSTLLFSGLGVGVIVSIAAPILGGADAAIPVALAATLWAVEAYARKNAWLAFPANGFYLLAYFIILLELNVDEPQFFSMGAALLGLIQHYLLVRAGSKPGAFIMGMVSQFVLLGTTYVEMLNKIELIYFFVLFFQSLAVLVYGLVIRSRSLTFFPIGFVALGVLTVVNNALEGVGAIFLIGCTGIILLILGVFAVLMRERISKLSERISDWQA